MGDDPDDKPRLSTPEPGLASLECWISGDSEEYIEYEEEEDVSEATARYVVGTDSIRFLLPPVDQGSLVVFDRLREVHVPSPWPWRDKNWAEKQAPWQRFYLDRGAGWLAQNDKETNQELWIAFLLDRGAGRHSRWWMEVELAFAHGRDGD